MFFLTKFKILSKRHFQTKHAKTTHYCILTVCMYVFVLIYHILKLAFSQFLRSFHRRLLRKSFPARGAFILRYVCCDSANTIQHEITSSCFVPISRYDWEVSSFPIRHLIIACNCDCKCLHVYNTHKRISLVLF